MKTIILINGSGGCGKSTFIRFCKMAHEQTIELSTVDYVKELARSVGWNGSKGEKDRAFLHDLKMALENWKDIPNLKVMKAIEEDCENDVFFVNVREINNIEKLSKHYKHREEYILYTVLVENNNVQKIISNEADANVNNYKYNLIIDNSGSLGQLLDKALYFMNGVILKGK